MTQQNGNLNIAERTWIIALSIMRMFGDKVHWTDEELKQNQRDFEASGAKPISAGTPEKPSGMWT